MDFGNYATSLENDLANNRVAKHAMSGTESNDCKIESASIQDSSISACKYWWAGMASLFSCRSMEQMSKQASHTVYRSAASMRPHMRTGLPQMNGTVDSPAYDESILERLQEVVCPIPHNVVHLQNLRRG